MTSLHVEEDIVRPYLSHYKISSKAMQRQQMHSVHTSKSSSNFLANHYVAGSQPNLTKTNSKNSKSRASSVRSSGDKVKFIPDKKNKEKSVLNHPDQIMILTTGNK